MKVGSSCKGCDHCEYEILDDYGCYDPGYYCDLKECPYEEEDPNDEEYGCGGYSDECEYCMLYGSGRCHYDPDFKRMLIRGDGGF